MVLPRVYNKAANYARSGPFYMYVAGPGSVTVAHPYSLYFRIGRSLSSLCQGPLEVYYWIADTFHFISSTIGSEELVKDHTTVAHFEGLYHFVLPIYVLEAIQRNLIYNNSFLVRPSLCHGTNLPLNWIEARKGNNIAVFWTFRSVRSEEPGTHHELRNSSVSHPEESHPAPRTCSFSESGLWVPALATISCAES